MSTTKPTDEKKERVTDKITQMFTSTIDMELEKEDAVSSIMETITKVGSALNPQQSGRVQGQIRAALDDLQNRTFSKVAEMGNNLWDKAKDE